MTRAKMEILELDFPIGLLSRYHDEGYVKSVFERSKQLDIKYGFFRDETGYVERPDIHTLGHTYEKIDLFKTQVHIYYLRQISRPNDVATRGHEETHAVESFGNKKLDLLAAKILEEQRVRLNFQEVDEEEVRADLGGISAVYARGMHVDLIVKISPYFEIAKKLYEQSRLPTRTINTP